MSWAITIEIGLANFGIGYMPDASWRSTSISDGPSSTTPASP
jgi:hypothetical protein